MKRNRSVLLSKESAGEEDFVKHTLKVAKSTHAKYIQFTTSSGEVSGAYLFFIKGDN